MTHLPSAQTLSRIETMLEQIYDTLQDIREETEQSWFTPEIQMEVKQAQDEAEHGDYTEFTNAPSLIAHLHSLS
ncbi:MAG: hypothetical protein Phog2KO_22140 [Phototrophicaceae bacterium]